MNTNEFRHPKERLQNLSSRHKVSTIYCVLFCVGFFLLLLLLLFFRERFSGERMLKWSRWELEGLSYNWRICLPPCAYLSVMCRLAVVQLTMQECGGLGTRVCWDQGVLFSACVTFTNNFPSSFSLQLQQITLIIWKQPHSVFSSARVPFAQKRTPVARTFKVFLWQLFPSFVHRPDSSRQRKQNRQSLQFIHTHKVFTRGSSASTAAFAGLCQDGFHVFTSFTHSESTAALLRRVFLFFSFFFLFFFLRSARRSH